MVYFVNLIIFFFNIQMGHGFSGYARYWENWVQWAIIVGVFLCTVRVLVIAKNLIVVLCELNDGQDLTKHYLKQQ